MYLPRFTGSTTHELKEPLSGLGTNVFSEQTDLSGITGFPELKLSKVTHKAVLTVNEEGTEAVGASASTFMPIPVVQTNVFNRPFLIIITGGPTPIIEFSTSLLARVESPTVS